MSEWIRCSDRLPRQWHEVIVWPHPTEYCMTAEVVGTSASGNPVWVYGEYVTGFGHESTEMTQKVTHWMEKPQAPTNAPQKYQQEK